MKVCSKCKVEQPIEEFYLRKTGKKESRCRTCCSSESGKWRRANPRTHIENQKMTLRQKYGMTLDQYDAMLAAQDGTCKICKSYTAGGFSGRFHVDHDHVTSKVRGLLCHDCNVGLGHFKDDISTLAKAIAYLQDNSRAGAP